jgi:hypothetical protein
MVRINVEPALAILQDVAPAKDYKVDVGCLEGMSGVMSVNGAGKEGGSLTTMISLGPPWMVAKVGSPQFIASITCNPMMQQQQQRSATFTS